MFPTVRGARGGPAGRLPRAPDRTGRLSVVRPGRPKCRTAVFGPDGGPYRVRHFNSGQGVDGGGLLSTAGKDEDGRGRWDYGGRQGTAGDCKSDVS